MSRPKRVPIVREPAYGEDGHLWVDADPKHDQLLCAQCGSPLAFHSSIRPKNVLTQGDTAKDHLGRVGTVLIARQDVVELDYGKQISLSRPRYGSWRPDTVTLIKRAPQPTVLKQATLF